MHHIIQACGLVRTFGPVRAVDGVDLSVTPGATYGFLGPNGAGKTTTIRMLLGLLRPQAGEILLFGRPLARERLALLRRAGALVESPSLYPHLTGYENLELIRRMIDATDVQVQRALNIVGLDPHGAGRRLVRSYSQGMRQRLGLAVALLASPELLILDEPTNGLDPAGIHEMRDLIRRMATNEGITIFLSSHLLSEVEQLATHIGIINEGRMIFEGTPDQLCASYHDSATLTADRLDDALRLLTQAGWSATHNGNHHLNIRVNGPSDVALLNRQLVQAGIQVYNLGLQQPTLEDIFLTITHDAARQA